MSKSQRYKGFTLFLENSGDEDEDNQYFVTIFNGAAQLDYTSFCKEPESAYREAKKIIDGWAD